MFKGVRRTVERDWTQMAESETIIVVAEAGRGVWLYSVGDLFGFDEILPIADK